MDHRVTKQHEPRRYVPASLAVRRTPQLDRPTGGTP